MHCAKYTDPAATPLKCDTCRLGYGQYKGAKWIPLDDSGDNK